MLTRSQTKKPCRDPEASDSETLKIGKPAISKKPSPLFKSKEKVSVKKAVLKQHRERTYKHKQFDFFYTRTCFRYMNEFYKESY